MAGLNVTPSHTTPARFEEEVERLSRASGWNKSVKSPYSGKHGFGSTARTPTPNRRRSCSGEGRRSRANGLTAAERATEAARDAMLGIVETPMPADIRASACAPNFPRPSLASSAFGFTSTPQFEAPGGPGLHPANTPMGIQSLVDLEVHDAAQDIDRESAGHSSPRSNATLSRIASLGERALSQGMTPKKEKAEDALSAFKAKMETMGFSVAEPAPAAADASAAQDGRPEGDSPDAPMSPTDGMLCQSARKSVTFRSPLTDVRKNTANQTTSSPMPTFTTPIVRLSFATEASLERHESDMSDGVCLYRESIASSVACEATMQHAGFHVQQTSVTPLKPRRRETIIFDKDDSDFGCDDDEEEDDEPGAGPASSDLPGTLSYRELQQLAKTVGVPCKGKKEALARAVKKALAASDAAAPGACAEEKYYSDDQREEAAVGDADQPFDGLSYRQLQLKAKAMNVNASGTRAALAARLVEASQ
ncbi:hypothetical protein DIPPA_04675 [Diplonema papillatum]|nr:hypothetical protein DIPPA_04675 [Diplonema papillatum]KAJ9451757.1 hypothetical protein DIPPA_04675 [Diplonema papillatum]